MNSVFRSVAPLKKFIDFQSGLPSPIVSVSRSLATATRVNQSGFIEVVNADTQRLDYSPVDLSPIGLLVEGTRSNILLYSNDFRNTADAGSTRPWVYDNTSLVPAAAISPDGTMSASKLVENSASSAHAIRQTVTTVASQVYATSVFVKGDGSGRNVRVFAFQSASPFTPLGFATVRLTDGAVINGSGTVQPWGNGWYRISFSGTAPSTATAFRIDVANGTSTNYLGNGVSGIFIYGGQLEPGSGATSYVPTVASAVTRNADVATIAGASFSDWWQSGRGSVLVKARQSTVSGTRPWVQFDDATADNIIALRGNTTNPELYIRSGGSDQVQIDAGTIAANTNYRFAGAWNANDCAASLNSGTPVFDGAATIPIVTQARIGSDGTNYLNGHIQAIEYYDERVLNASLQVLSSQAGRRSIIGPVFRGSIIS